MKYLKTKKPPASNMLITITTFEVHLLPVTKPAQNRVEWFLKSKQKENKFSQCILYCLLSQINAFFNTMNCQAQPSPSLKPQLQAWLRLALFSQFTPPPKKVPKLEIQLPKPYQTKQHQWKITSMKDDLNGRRPQWKTTLMEDDLNGR